MTTPSACALSRHWHALARGWHARVGPCRRPGPTGMLSPEVRMVAGAPRVRVDVLGPLRLEVDGTVVDVPGTRRRAVLALLALAQGRTVTVDALVDALWPHDPPASARQALQSHVSRLRGHLGPASGRLASRADGYVLDADTDVVEVGAALRRSRSAAPDEALAVLRSAASAWRGPVLADLRDVAPVAAAAVACDRLRQDVLDALVAAGIDAGRAADVLPEARAVVADDPLREDATLLLVRALAATGRAPDALRLAHDYRRRLAEETGLDPTPALGALERQVAGGGDASARTRTGVDGRAPGTRLVGRDDHVRGVRGALAEGRLVTVVGPGGVGKTRVAMAAAGTDDDATLLSLAPLGDAAAVPHALADALGLVVTRGDVLRACVALLGDRRALLVVDNAEHLLDAVRDVVAVLLTACPRLVVLVTSREPLGLPAERTWRLPPLDVPADDDPALADVASVALFLDRAARVRPGAVRTAADLRVVADVVRRLDGMPLAIELAAGRMSAFGLRDLRDRLDRALDLLGDGRPTGDARHRTLRATIAWSDDLLSPDERLLLRRLAVFPDGLDLPDVERLAHAVGLRGDPGTVLARLVDASVVEVDVDDGPRYRLLQTVRAYALDALAAEGDRAAADRDLLRWASDVTARVAAAMTTEREPEADATLRREVRNLRAAWHLARATGDVDTAATLVVRLFDAVGYRDLVELRGWAVELAADPRLDTSPLAAAVLGVGAEAAYHGGDHARAESLARAGLRRASDDEGRWCCLLPLSVVDLARGRLADAAAHASAAAGLRPDPREALGIAALATAYAGDLAAAALLADRGRAAAVAPTMRAWAAYVDGELANLGGAPDDARARYEEAVRLARTSGATFVVGVATVGLLTVLARTGREDEALAGYRDVVDDFARTGNWTHLWATLRDLADLLARLGDTTTADLVHAAADAAPDAPADGRARVARPGHVPRVGRADLLDTVRTAVDRARASGPPA
ncbi:BTAD domain-containing putative transcriptional regulator [Cellulomonas fimi]|uniref:BTAD domain-containing putative transcriptional regulator n=1 Tax=Cellulomonas fimi TaxID=1708 RepID=UPI0018D5246C|nr:BTAD domain-containing putative transcriptional regulator [Cellulomonas fimi]